MLKNVLIFSGTMPPDLLARLQSKFAVTVAPLLADRPAFLHAAKTAHGLIGSFVTIGPEELADTPALEVISTISAGVDNYDVPYLTSRRILLTNTPGALTQTTADTAFLLIMAAARRAVELAEYIKEGQWTAGLPPAMYGTDIHGKTLGIVGLGRIGAAIARRGHHGFGMKILYASRTPKPAVAAGFSAQHVPLDDLLSQSDFVCVAVPLSPGTHHLFGTRQFSLMKPSAIFINIARGAVVDEPALIAALTAGQIHAAGLDVFETEPLPLSSPLLKMKNVVALPHIGSATHQTRRAMVEAAVDNLEQALDGHRPADCVNGNW